MGVVWTMETDQELIDRLVPTIATKTAQALRLLGESKGHLTALEERFPDIELWDEIDQVKEAMCSSGQVLASMVLFNEDMKAEQEVQDDTE